MMVKLEKIISCSSEHPQYPAANLLQRNSENWKATWRCSKPGEMLAHVIFQLAEPSYITGVDIGNYQSCVVIVTGSTSMEPDNWIVIINHKFMTNNEAADNKFKDQVQLFTKRELNPDILKMKFDRIKVTCMQSANLKVLFGLSYIILRSDPIIDLGLDAFGKFKLKQPHVVKTPMEMMKEKNLNRTENIKTDYKKELYEQIKKDSMENFIKSQQEQKSVKRPLLEKLEAGEADQVFGKHDKTQSQCPKDKEKMFYKSPKNIQNVSEEKVVRTPFGDIVPSRKTDTNQNDIKNATQGPSNSKKRSLIKLEDSPNAKLGERKKQRCSECCTDSQDQLCATCQRLVQPKDIKNASLKVSDNVPVKLKKPFKQLFSNVTFSLSGYVNPQRDEIRRKALNMGARYIPDPNTTNNKCTHLICAFKNTPKYQQFKNHTKIVSHTFIEECFDKKKRFPWRRYALDQKDKLQPESEEEIDGDYTETVYDMDTDADSDY
ncbi:DNA repair protein XRCC1 [Solenopsis invicta]|uniref:DNA repair protein XRCC1 n=1 Tax=Solenopsis invicta TaxID=13686 RepID=UPI00193D06DF|nr:DNA repair protein XRCC1 [Solenopsis invicta]XP_039311871.1 DNA repair protein XRCC1 [Solenopsis invicta]XP_039311872.1 DNA repair protein XRCC1 [Solenopsis invicta]XP_039311873.1 DNA repair protein XRCC1 [Solenopsis invicta]